MPLSDCTTVAHRSVTANKALSLQIRLIFTNEPFFLIKINANGYMSCDLYLNAIRSSIGTTLAQMYSCYSNILLVDERISIIVENNKMVGVAEPTKITRICISDTVIGLAAQKAFLVAAAVGIISAILTGSVIITITFTTMALFYSFAHFTKGLTPSQIDIAAESANASCATSLGKITRNAIISFGCD